MLKTLKNLMNLMERRKSHLNLSLLLSLIDGFLVIVPVLIAFKIAGAMPELFPEAEHRLTSAEAWRNTLIMVSCVLIRIVLRYCTIRLRSGTAYEALCDLRKKLGHELRGVSMSYFSRKNLGDLVAVMTFSTSLIEIEGMSVVEKIAIGIPSLIVGMTVLFWFDSRIALVVALLFIPTWFAYIHLATTQQRHNLDLQQQVEQVTEDTVKFINGLPVMKTYGMTDELFRRTHMSFRRLKEFFVTNEFSHLSPTAVFQVCFRTMIAAMLLMAGLFVIDGDVTRPSAFLLMLGSLTLFSGVEMMGIYSIFSVMMQKCIDRVVHLQDISQMDENRNGEILTRFDVVFDHVSFAYDSVPVLADISFTVPEKTTTALVGLSGSGKSTIANLIARFWDVQKGTVFVGGTNIKDLCYENLLKNVSFVFQDVFLFDDTVANNIRLGRPDATRDEVIESATRAECHEFIAAMDRGYETIVGMGGARLSGGEKRRLSIARALLKNAPIVLLDEVTANIDVEHERCIQRALQELLKDKTVVMIAHKLSTVRHVDQILVIEQGRISQKGTHCELLSQEGLYQRLWNMQYETATWKF